MLPLSAEHGNGVDIVALQAMGRDVEGAHARVVA
jgi:hypothetical protein